MAGTVTLRPPSGVPLSMMRLLARGLVPFAIGQGLGAVRRLLWVKNAYEALEKDVAAGQVHVFVHMMAVDPALQGRGLGSELLGRALSQATASYGELRIVLTTHLPQNVVFYRRAGFEVWSEREMRPPGSAPYTVWSMAK